MEKNWQYVDVGSLLQSYGKYPELQERVVFQFKMLLDFLTSEHLLVGPADEWKTRDIDKLQIFAADLTEEGRQLFSPPIDAFFKWLSANDRDARKPVSMRSLENGLKKIRLKTY